MSEGVHSGGGGRYEGTELWQHIHALRKSIDNLDTVLVFTLAERFKATGRIGELKAAAGAPAQDLRRQADQEARLMELAACAGVEPDIVVAVLRAISAEVIRRHEQIAQQRGV